LATGNDPSTFNQPFTWKKLMRTFARSTQNTTLAMAPVKTLATILLLAFGAMPLHSEAQEPSYDIHCGKLLDVEKQQVVNNQHILVRNGVIAEIGTAVDAPADAIRIDRSRQVCAPGLFDSHVHLTVDSTKSTVDVGRLQQSSAYNALLGVRNAQKLLNTGFTTLRLPGDFDPYFATVEVKNAFARGDFIGPRMLVAPHAWSPTGGHGDANSLVPDQDIPVFNNIADGVEGVRLAVRNEIKYGADWIKIMGTGGVMSQHDDPEVAAYTQEEFNAFADETHRHKKKITAHIHGDSGARMAVQAGFDSIEHGTMLKPETIQMMAEQGTYLIPTRYVLDWILEKGQSGGITANNLAKAQLVAKTHADVMRAAYKAGVPMALGSDPIFPMEESIREFAAMARIIGDNWFVLRAGTIAAAEMLELDQLVGSLAVGKQADIVAMPLNPIDDMKHIEEVNFVMIGGRVVRGE
jgi:imidazolonepropionase-like amidohydrolase